MGISKKEISARTRLRRSRRIRSGSSLLLEEALQPTSALDQWRWSRALAVQEHKIDGEEDKLIGAAFVHGCLELAKHRHTVSI